MDFLQKSQMLVIGGSRGGFMSLDLPLISKIGLTEEIRMTGKLGTSWKQ